MKTILLLILTLLPLQRIFALHIAQVSVAALSETALNISMNTEAEELYYFQSWQYGISGNTIVLEALFITGFGSTMAYLNTNCQILMNTTSPVVHYLIVKVYYTNYEPENLQETVKGYFATPITTSVLLDKKSFPTPNAPDFYFVNPCNNGTIAVNPEIETVWIFDITGKCVQKHTRIQGNIQLSNYQDGIYMLGYFRRNQFKIKRIILKNQ